MSHQQVLHMVISFTAAFEYGSCDVSAGNLKNSSSEGGTKVGLFIMQNDRCLDFNSFSVYSNTF